jgi:hypothetical protein
VRERLQVTVKVGVYGSPSEVWMPMKGMVSEDEDLCVVVVDGPRVQKDGIQLKIETLVDDEIVFVIGALRRCCYVMFWCSVSKGLQRVWSLWCFFVATPKQSEVKFVFCFCLDQNLTAV